MKKAIRAKSGLCAGENVQRQAPRWPRSKRIVDDGQPIFAGDQEEGGYHGSGLYIGRPNARGEPSSRGGSALGAGQHLLLVEEALIFVLPFACRDAVGPDEQYKYHDEVGL